jgi:hypothetical protein
MVQEGNGSLVYAPFGVGSWFLSTPFGLPLLVPIYPLRSMKRAIVEGPKAPQSGAIFPRQVRILSLALVADDIAFQGSSEVALDLPICLLGIPRLIYVERYYAIGSISLPPLKPYYGWVKFNQERRDALVERQSCCRGQFYI